MALDCLIHEIDAVMDLHGHSIHLAAGQSAPTVLERIKKLPHSMIA